MGEGAAPEAAMLQIEKERSWAKPKQLPAGPRKKRPLGRFFSSRIYLLPAFCNHFLVLNTKGKIINLKIVS